MEFKKIAVIGAGTMGNGIAQVFAQNNYPVILIDIKEEILNSSLEKIKKNLSKALEKGKITELQFQETLNNLKISTKLEEAKDADLIVEAVLEEIKLKKEIYQTLDQICKPEAILASNTSSISITELGSATKRPEKVIGMHFMNPVPLMKLVEVIRGLVTDNQVVKDIMELSQSLGKTPVEVNDYPGFISNRILIPMINEAIYALMEKVASKEAIDTVMKLGMNHPMGPLELADLIGLDICLAVMEVLYRDFSDSKYRPCPLLKKMVKAGK
ncbi:MAG: 3-hydroxybutyryl-CoA dehydrogenase, partial [Armatimonadetes bacterium]|nr:3-hydroxybutyryl-CoA dehydrogenase [Armatimonadota bacterium]